MLKDDIVLIVILYRCRQKRQRKKPQSNKKEKTITKPKEN